MNNAAQLVSESLAGISFKTMQIAGRSYTIYPPTIKVMARGFAEWSKVNAIINEAGVSFADIPNNAPIILRGLCYFMTKDGSKWEIRSEKLYERLLNGEPSITIPELLDAIKAVIELIGVNDFFVCAALLENVVKIAATPQ